ncbi:MAG: amidase [Gammaproteobacteria bacterium]|nr:MAG: amidase [Gammaproteobacteria bacterium]
MPPSALNDGDSAVHYLTLTEVAALLESRQVSPVELAQHMLERIDQIDGRLKSYATVTADRALAAARRAEQEIAAGRYRGLLHGVPIAVKDLCFTKGTRTMGGLSVRRDFVPDHDATVVSRLEDQGAVLLGKLALTEGAMAGYHPDFPIPVNPWNEDYWSGASSSGSGVATAAGLCFAALGSDTGGSIRFPSMANGVVGLKPTYGLVSRHGILPLSETLDHVGPMTRSTADAAIVLQAMAGHDDSDPTSLANPAPDLLRGLHAGISGARIGFDREYACEGIDAGLVASIEQALLVLSRLGATIVDVQMPAGIKDIEPTWFAICSAEAYAAHKATFPSRADEYGPHFRELLEMGAAITDEQYQAATQLRDQFSEQYEAVLGTVDAMVCPSGGLTFPVPPDLQYGDTETLQPLFQAVQMYFTIPSDFSGTPALTVPCGFSDSGLPYALQFVGARLSEATLCRIGHAYEQASPWHDRHPQI